MSTRYVRKLTIAHPTVKESGSTTVFTITADNHQAKPVRLEVQVPTYQLKGERRESTLHQVNGKFLNSLRYLKHFGNLPRKEPDPGALNSVWSQTDTNTMAIRPADDPMKEFPRFT
jgi:hypothetical protein